MKTVTDPREIAGLLRFIDDSLGNIVTRCALQLVPLVFVRPGKLRQADWTENNFDDAEWRIPVGKMKDGIQHSVPLSRQAMAVFREIHPLLWLLHMVIGNIIQIKPADFLCRNLALKLLDRLRQQLLITNTIT